MTKYPLHWKTKRLEDVADVIDPHPSHRAPAIDPKGIPFVGIGDVREDGIADFRKARLVSPKILSEHAERYSLETDLIGLGRVASVGKVVKLPKGDIPYTISPTLAVISPVEISFDFLYYALQSPQIQNQLTGLKQGSGRQSVGILKLRTVVVPFPPADEQNEIVEILEDHLSRLDAALEDVKQAKLKAAQFRRSLLKSTFEKFIDHSVRMGDVVTFNRKKPVEFKNSKSEVSFVPMPKVSEVSGQILLDECISHSEGQRRSLTYFEDGDVIFAKITPCMENGKIALAKNLLNGAAYGSTEFHVLTPMESILPDYLRYFIGSDDFRANAERAMTGAVGQRRVPKTYLEEHAIPLPNIDIQAGIVANLDEGLSRTDEAVKLAEKIEREAGRLRRSIFQAAFIGQLTKEVVSV